MAASRLVRLRVPVPLGVEPGPGVRRDLPRRRGGACSARSSSIGATLGQRLDPLDQRRTSASLRRLREHAPEPARAVRLAHGHQTNVFVPVLLGAGVVLSALAWVVDRLARLTAVPTMERGLARKLTTMQPEPGGLLGEPPTDPFAPR